MANDRQGFIDESEEATPLKGGKAKDAAAAGDGGTAAANGSGGGEGWLLQRLGLRHLASRLRGAHQPPSRGDEGGGGQQQHHPRQQQRRRSRLLLEQLAGWANCTKKWSPPRMPKVPKRAERQIRLLGPLLLPLSLAVYLLLGAAAFLFLEHTNHEQTVRKWFFNLIVNRHKFARQISSAIFNGTRNMLVIVDYDSSERIQRDLIHLLSQYEQHLELRVPDLNEWTLLNSLCYCWGLLTTIGHGHRAPKTGAGQVFSLFYCLLGVPFFVITLIVVSHRLFLLCGTGFQLFVSKKRASLLANHRLLLLLLLCSLYGLWLLLFALLLFAYAIPESFWRSLYTAVLASLTIQSADYNALSEPQKLLTLGGASISLQLACICIFSMTGLWRYGRGATAGGQRRGTTEGGGGGMQQRPKFKVVVNEVGSTKLAASVSAPNSPPTENGSSHGNGAGKRGQQQPK